VVESIKIITRNASMRVAKYAFHYTQLHGRKRVSAIHKANIMKKTDGLFLEVTKRFEDILAGCSVFRK
jgi:isocitrate dehydrogenase (NAD+)